MKNSLLPVQIWWVAFDGAGHDSILCILPDVRRIIVWITYIIHSQYLPKGTGVNFVGPQEVLTASAQTIYLILVSVA